MVANAASSAGPGTFAMQPRDKDYIQTEEDLIFAVLGYEHPPEYVVCMLKAIAGKKWTASYPETIAFLSERYPQYVIRRCDIPRIIVPRRRAVRHWRPAWGLLPWRQNRSQLHELQRMTLELADVLAGETQIPTEHFAVVDSLLWGGERADSDIDLVVRSAESMQAVMRFLQQPWHDPF